MLILLLFNLKIFKSKENCTKKDTDSLMHHFVVIKKCLSDYECKIYEALLIKKHQPKLNKHL